MQPGSDAADALAERHREQSAVHYDELQPGLAPWLRAAIVANAEHRG